MKEGGFSTFKQLDNSKMLDPKVASDTFMTDLQAGADEEVTEDISKIGH